jgi:AcrR family transcriptional regulator
MRRPSTPSPISAPIGADAQPAPPRRGRGRPRDPSVESAVLAAVRQSLIEDGFEATTIPSIARRTGIGAPTIYRRWPTQVELVEAIFDDVLFGQQLEVPTDEGDFVQVVQLVAEGAFYFFGHPAARRAIPGLLAAYNGEPNRLKALTDRLEVPARKVFRKVHANAVRQGRAAKRPDADVLFSTIVGSAIYLGGVWGETNGKAMRNTIEVVVKSSGL